MSSERMSFNAIVPAAAAVILVISVTSFYLFPRTASSAWWDTSWQYRQTVTVSSANISEDLTDFPVYLDLSEFDALFFSQVRTDGGDIRITDANDVEIPREIVAIDTSAQTGEVHFKAPALSSSSDTVFYVYYGNVSATDYAVTDTYGAQNVWTNNYELVLHMGGGTLTDSTANGNNSDTNQGTADVGPLGAATDFSGTQRATVPHSTSISSDIRTAVTYSMWFVTDAAYGTNTGTLEKSEQFFFANFAGAGNMGPILKVGGANIVANSGTMSTATWYHIAAVFSQSAGTLKAYRDGVVRGTTSGISGMIDNRSTSLYIGGDDTNRRLNGRIDELRIQSVARSDGWLAAEYANQSSPSTFYAVGSSETAPSAGAGEGAARVEIIGGSTEIIGGEVEIQ